VGNALPCRGPSSRSNNSAISTRRTGLRGSRATVTRERPGFAGVQLTTSNSACIHWHLQRPPRPISLLGPDRTVCVLMAHLHPNLEGLSCRWSVEFRPSWAEVHAPGIEHSAGRVSCRGQVVDPDIEPGHGKVFFEERFDLVPVSSGEAAADAWHVDERSLPDP